MENVHQVVKRVEKILYKRLPRLNALVVGTVLDPRKTQGARHDFGDDALALLAGLLCLRTSLRRVETLSADLGLGRDGTGSAMARSDICSSYATSTSSTNSLSARTKMPSGAASSNRAGSTSTVLRSTASTPL
jgi:hypothetical protein